jgi:hypothetical protein
VASFQRWMDGYREDAELLHGYGTSALSRSKPTPATRWVAQLASLDATAQRQRGRPFAALAPAQRRSIVEHALETIGASRIPAVGQAPHVALAQLGHYYDSADATDRCYGAHIGKQNCRPLAASPRKPLPMAPVTA